MVQSKRPCPLCKTPLTLSHYNRVLGIQADKERNYRDRLAAMRKELADERKEMKRAAELNAKNQAAEIVKAEIAKNENKNQRTIVRLNKALEKSNKELVHLKNGTDQAQVGRAWDGQMRDFIAAEFEPLGDSVTLTPGSRQGDVIHEMRQNGTLICRIMIENKTGDKITKEFIDKATLAKGRRVAKYGLIVTNGARRGFEGGLKGESEILLVKPAALLTLLHIIREVHVELARATGTSHKIDTVAKNLVAYISGDDFGTPLSEIRSMFRKLETLLSSEQQTMTKSWRDRAKYYAQGMVSADLIRENAHVILEGKLPNRRVVPFSKPVTNSMGERTVQPAIEVTRSQRKQLR